jgi:hypothetical protein
MKFKVLLACGIFGSGVALAGAQQQTCDGLVRGHVAALQQAQTEAKANPHDAGVAAAVDRATLDLNADLNWNGGPVCLVGLILRTMSNKVGSANAAKDLEAALKAAFQQNGSSSGTGGSTNLVSKGATAELLAVAANYGALTESASGSTVTVQGTVGGIPTALENKGILPPCSGVLSTNCVANSTVNFLNRFSYTIGFDTSQNSQSVSGAASSTSSQGTAQPATFSASGHTLNSMTAKGAVIRAPVANAAAISAAISKLTQTSLPVAADAKVTAASTKLMKDCPQSVIQDWMTETFEKLKNQDTGDADGFANAWFNRGQPLVDALNANSTCKGKYLSDSQAVAAALNSYLVSLNSFFEGLRATPVLSVEYDYNSPQNQPTNSTIRLIGQVNKGSFTGSLNAAGSFYNSTPSVSIPSATRVRDFQVGAEGSYGFGKPTKSAFLGTSTASLAYYYQDQTSPAILNVTPGQPLSGITITGLPPNATQVYAQRGIINIGQAKFTWIPSNLNINFPVSVTWSNRTELVTSPVWRGQIGISYDFDSLFSK